MSEILGVRKYLKHHNSFGTVAVGNVFAEIPRGVKLFQTILEILDGSGNPVSLTNMKADIDEISFLDGNNQVVNQISPTELLDIEKYLGNTNSAGLITIYHALPNLDQKLARFQTDGESLAYGTIGANKLTVRVKLNSVANISEINLKGLVSDANEVRGSYITLGRHNREFNSIDEQELSDLPMNVPGRTKLLEMFNKNTLDSINVKHGGRDIIENMSKTLIEHLQVNAGRTLITGKFCLDFMLDNIFRLSDFLTLNTTEMRYDINWTTAPGSYNIVVMTLND